MHPFTKVGAILKKVLAGLGWSASVSSPNPAMAQVQQAMLEEEKWTTPSMTYFR